MSLDVHRHAELLMGRADQASVEGRMQDAARLRCEAAELEAQVFGMVPLDRPRTRGVIAVSSVALYRKGKALDQAIRQAEAFLKLGNLPEFARRDLEEMIEEMRAEQYVSIAYSDLTPREQRVLALRLAGVAQREIAARLNVSSRTIQRTMERVRRQLQASDSARESPDDAATNGLRQKLVTLTA